MLVFMMNKMKAISLALLLLLLLLTSPAFAAYLEKYPPFDPDKTEFEIAFAPEIANPFMEETTVKEGAIEIKISRPEEFKNSVSPYGNLEVRHNGKLAFVFNKDEEYPTLFSFCYFDVDKNGLNDLVAGAGYNGNSLGAFDHRGIIFLQVQDGVFKQLSYKTMFYGPEDFVDVNKDGKYEIMTMNLYQDDGVDGKTHSFWVYNLYAFDGEDLVLANELSPIFPKFIWFTHKPNDKETDKLSKEQKAKYIASLPQRIKAAVTGDGRNQI